MWLVEIYEEEVQAEELDNDYESDSEFEYEQSFQFFWNEHIPYYTICSWGIKSKQISHKYTLFFNIGQNYN